MNIGERQRKLSLWAVQDKELRLYDLYGLLCNRKWLLAAYDHVKRNTGSRTAGIDKITATDFEEHLDSHIDTLREELKTQTFTPDPVRRMYRPKRQGTWRPLRMRASRFTPGGLRSCSMEITLPWRATGWDDTRRTIENTSSNTRRCRPKI
jgi:hypothetical protein